MEFHSVHSSPPLRMIQLLVFSIKLRTSIFISSFSLHICPCVVQLSLAPSECCWIKRQKVQRRSKVTSFSQETLCIKTYGGCWKICWVCKVPSLFLSILCRYPSRPVSPPCGRQRKMMGRSHSSASEICGSTCQISKFHPGIVLCTLGHRFVFCMQN